jgi:peptidoglycan hydrolase-like protein with peptidoglycan-binding domain
MLTFITKNSPLNAEESLQNARCIFDYLTTVLHWTQEAACGLLGNTYIESKNNPGAWQSYKEGNLTGGYGIVQWTPASKYIDWAKSNGYDPAGMEGQLLRLKYEMDNGIQYFKTSDYPLTFKQFVASKESPDYLAIAFVKNYERPKNPDVELRAQKAMEYYQLFKERGQIMYDPQKVISLALGEVGYKEKKTKENLDDKTANAGTKNYTRYAAIMDKIPNYYNGGKQGAAWCDVFVDCMFYLAYGDAGRKMLYQPERSLGAGCKYSRRYYEQNKRLFDEPKPGDQIFFWPKNHIDSSSVQHTGLVVSVDAKYVYTVEGNSSNEVRQKKYALTEKTIAGYGRPNWGDGVVAPAPKPDPQPNPEPKPENPTPTLKKDVVNKEAVKKMQERLNLHGKETNYALLGRTNPLDADGDFGNYTDSAVRAFQKGKGLTIDGICGPKTWAELIKEPQKPEPLYEATISKITKAQVDKLLAEYPQTVTKQI